MLFIPFVPWQVEYAQTFGSDAICRALILSNLGEPSAPDPKQVIREDPCENVDIRDVVNHAITALQLVRLKSLEGDFTMNMIVKEWRSKNAPEW